ncbi:hypothetical protein [Lactococcus lactis]|uniref:Uncharacterized protein n=1 Tax=Lactococcus lactis TaxID=1358 RepID=A0AB35KEQ5_9LACT|nr:hypothetical protein [Lactococcus lactis]MDG5049555.1 hypothetical protein [Lactococcus lactis]
MSEVSTSFGSNFSSQPIYNEMIKKMMEKYDCDYQTAREFVDSNT